MGVQAILWWAWEVAPLPQTMISVRLPQQEAESLQPVEITRSIEVWMELQIQTQTRLQTKRMGLTRWKELTRMASLRISMPREETMEGYLMPSSLNLMKISQLMQMETNRGILLSDKLVTRSKIRFQKPNLSFKVLQIFPEVQQIRHLSVFNRRN